MSELTERHARLDGPIHSWFGLTYSNYLVLHRSMMQSMPVAWQERAVALFDELDGAFPDLERPPSFIVTPAVETEYAELDQSQMTELGIDCPGALCEHPNDCDCPPDDVYFDREGNEHGAYDRLLVPIAADPVPHYNRGRTFIEPTGLAAPDAS